MNPASAIPCSSTARMWSANAGWLASAATRSVALAPSRRTFVVMTPSSRVRAKTVPATRTSPRQPRANGASSTPRQFAKDRVFTARPPGSCRRRHAAP